MKHLHALTYYIIDIVSYIYSVHMWLLKALLLQNGGNGAFGVSAVRAVMEVLDIAGESVSQVYTALVVQRRRSLATSTSLVVRKSKDNI